MASFSDRYLPTELVESIFGYLSQASLYSLCRTSKSISSLALSFLYRDVDLFIPPSNKLPRIDRFCLAIINDPKQAARVNSIRLGLCPGKGVKEGQRWLPVDKSFDDSAFWERAREGLRSENLMATGDYLRDAIKLREYSSYAALTLLFLPSLKRLDMADYKSATFDHLHTILRNLDSATAFNKRHSSQALINRLSSIKHVSLIFDKHSGVAYPSDNKHYLIDHFLHISQATTLELSIPGDQLPRGPAAGISHPLVRSIRLTNITKLVFRHSGPILGEQLSLLESTPLLRSFTYEMFWDCSERGERELSQVPRLIHLSAWSDALRKVENTLEVLVFSAEYCDTSAYFFAQPRIGEKLYGYLDLTAFKRLHTLEAPFAFLTGDAEFSLTTEIYPLLPPNLKHLSLRPDLSHAQSPFPFDSSILPKALTFKESKEEAQYLMNARMDVSYMFQASLTILEQAYGLETIAVCQPADPALEWFDGQVNDFAITCRNKGVTGKLVVPMLLRWKKAEHWDLVGEVTVYDRLEPKWGMVKKFFRQEWEGRPTGLASQFHLYALGTHKIRLHR